MEFFTLIFSVMLRGTSVCCFALSSFNPFTFNSFHSSSYSLCATQTQCATTPCILPALPGMYEHWSDLMCKRGRIPLVFPFPIMAAFFITAIKLPSLPLLLPPLSASTRPPEMRQGWKPVVPLLLLLSLTTCISPTGFSPSVPPVPTPLP